MSLTTRIFHFLARLPLPLMQRLGAALGWCVWWLSPSYRRNFKANVQAGMKMRPGKGRLVSGPGGPKDDMVPAIVDGDQPVALSNGEYVLSADAVAGAGDGDPMAGAEALNELNARLAKRAA